MPPIARMGPIKGSALSGFRYSCSPAPFPLCGSLVPSNPPPGRLAAIDYGDRRIGIALTDPEQRFASPVDNHTRGDEAAEAKYFRRLAAEERIVRFVVGLPVHLSGRESEKSRDARSFGAWLAETTGVPVVFFDERLHDQRGRTTDERQRRPLHQEATQSAAR